MEFAEMGHRREECPNLPVSLLVLRALRLECEKSMELTLSEPVYKYIIPGFWPETSNCFLECYQMPRC